MTMAVAVLPSPGSVVVLRTSDGSTSNARVLGHDHCVLLSPLDSGVPVDGPCSVIVLDERRAGFEITGYAQPADVGAAHGRAIRVVVESVRRLKSRRSAPRAIVRESALIDSPSEAFDVDLIDVGGDGMAFVSDQAFQVGDAVSAMLNVENSVIRVRAEVANCTGLGLGRRRVGCRFTSIAEIHRAQLAGLAGRTPFQSDRRRGPDATATPYSALVKRLAAGGSAHQAA